jgi:hypothetical protein
MQGALHRLARWAAHHPWIAMLLVVGIPSVALGYALTWSGTSTWDSAFQLGLSRYLLRRTLPVALQPESSPATPPFLTEYYGPLWELSIGLVADGLLEFLRDPEWTRHALTFALFPVTLASTWILLARSGVPRSTAFVCVALLVGVVRFGGHALLNTKDLPYACAFLLASLATWRCAQDLLTPVHPRWQAAARLGLIAMVPALIRPGAPLHLAVCFALIVAACAVRRDRRAALVLLAAYGAAAAALAYATWPTLRDEGPIAFFHAYRLAARYPWRGPVRVFDHTYPNTALPWWYALAWWPVIMHPLTLLATVVGVTVFAVSARAKTPSFVLDAARARFPLSLGAWLGALTATAWASVLVAQPWLLNEERHILFLFLPVVVLAGLGLGALQKRVRVGLAVVLVLAPLPAYATWRSEAYVYASPLIGDQRTTRFDGDYWGLCVQDGVRALHGRVPAGATVALRGGPIYSAGLQMSRLAEGRFTRMADGAEYRFAPYEPGPERPAYVLLYNGAPDGAMERLVEDVKAGRARELWSEAMPMGEIGCLLAVYER